MLCFISWNVKVVGNSKFHQSNINFLQLIYFQKEWHIYTGCVIYTGWNKMWFCKFHIKDRHVGWFLIESLWFLAEVDNSNTTQKKTKVIRADKTNLWCKMAEKGIVELQTVSWRCFSLGISLTVKMLKQLLLTSLLHILQSVSGMKSNVSPHFGNVK